MRAELARANNQNESHLAKLHELGTLRLDLMRIDLTIAPEYPDMVDDYSAMRDELQEIEFDYNKQILENQSLK